MQFGLSMEGKSKLFNIKMLESYSPLQEPIPILCEDLEASAQSQPTEDADCDVRSNPIWIKHQNLVPMMENGIKFSYAC